MIIGCQCEEHLHLMCVFSKELVHLHIYDICMIKNCRSSLKDGTGDSHVCIGIRLGSVQCMSSQFDVIFKWVEDGMGLLHHYDLTQSVDQWDLASATRLSGRICTAQRGLTSKLQRSLLRKLWSMIHHQPGRDRLAGCKRIIM